MRVEIYEIKQKISETKNCLFEINKIYRTLARWIRKKKTESASARNSRKYISVAIKS